MPSELESVNRGFENNMHETTDRSELELARAPNPVYSQRLTQLPGFAAL